MKTVRTLVHEITDMIIDYNMQVKNHEESIHLSHYAYHEKDDTVTTVMTSSVYQDNHTLPYPSIYIDLRAEDAEAHLKAAKETIERFIATDIPKVPELKITPTEVANV